MPRPDDVWVNLRPCGCLRLAVPAGRPGGLETMKASITRGWSLHRRSGDSASRLPTACDTCAPVRQEQLL